MKIGAPKEIAAGENRVAMTPDGVREFERAGVSVLVETGAGAGAAITDEDFLVAETVVFDNADDAVTAVSR